ncbi:MAG: hypothetical protein C4520_10280 [Candidatus Abyssobacteria bacterium SURF_5]|uniref:Uncharacterized protein n=1 Tax=Abyssobacteria bacterium (strain SURF_5) TaxID=2093360 RepID=A0A3A4NR76_ABYX5|nr:MAG: hypothetical protein C4520_10280 [Candidatus Abyssubacteria bacterium SURF_5]
MIFVTCPYCKSSGYITPPPADTILMGPCPICGEPVALYNSKVIGLRKKAAGDGKWGEQIQSLAKIIMEYINTQGAPMDEGSLERIIREAEDRVFETEKRPDNLPSSAISPSVRYPGASPITIEELEDFLKIDLNLLARKDYFDKFFG